MSVHPLEEFSYATAHSRVVGSRLEAAMLILVLIAATVLRCWKLDQPLMWCDEAESAINSLTILDHGVPTESYLGLPIFENVLLEPWPQSAEYEFRDSSYSDKGLAVYHGWLPLYVTAGSLRAFGIRPATDDSRLTAKYSTSELSMRTIAARLPAVVFSIVFLILLFVTADEMYGKDAAWAALLAASVAVPIVHIARQARYYSLTLALCMGCCLMIWRMSRCGRWRDYLAGAALLAALFHTHILTFLIVCAAGMIMLPWILRREGSIVKMFGAGIVAAAGIIPWMVHSGFLDTAPNIPKAASMLWLPWDLFIYPIDRWPVTMFLVGSAIWMWSVQLLSHRLPPKLALPFLESRGAFYFLAAWGLIGWLAFMLLIPAASLWFPRAYLGIVGPGIVLAAIMFAAAGRAIGPRAAIPIGCVLFLAFIYANARETYSWNRDSAKTEKVSQVIDRMRNWKLRPGSRIYATPSDHLILTWYTDVPVQSIAPVRKSFLDAFPGDVVIIECFTRFVPIPAEMVQSVAGTHHVAMPRLQAQRWANRLTALAMRNYLVDRVREVDVKPEPKLPKFAADLLGQQQELTRRGSHVPDNPVAANPAIFRGYDIPDNSYFWQVFFYRFVGVPQRSGENLNYAQRIRNATATVLPGTYVIYRSPGTTAETRADP
jgi:hypothetical protein